MQELVPRHGGLFHTQRQGLHAPGASGGSNWFCNTIVFVQHRFAISHRPTPLPPSGRPRSHRATAQSFPSRIPQQKFTTAQAPEPDPANPLHVSQGSRTGSCIPRQLFATAKVSRHRILYPAAAICGSQYACRGFPAPDSVSCGSYLRQPVCLPGLPGTGFCILRQLFAAALHARRGIPTPARQNPLDGPACPPARTFANIANIIRMHERVLSDENAGWGLVRQTSAALVAASLEDLSAVRGSHSLTEAVNLASLSLFRLICSEH